MMNEQRNEQTDKQTNEQTCQKQYAPNFFKIGGIKTVKYNKAATK